MDAAAAAHGAHNAALNLLEHLHCMHVADCVCNGNPRQVADACIREPHYCMKASAATIAAQPARSTALWRLWVSPFWWLQIPAGTNAAGAAVKGSTPQTSAADLAALECPLIGHAIECRLCAEDPCHGLTPARHAAPCSDFHPRSGLVMAS